MATVRQAQSSLAAQVSCLIMGFYYGIFDLSDVCYVDSSGVGILVMCCARRKKAGGGLYLVGVQGSVEEALVMTSVNLFENRTRPPLAGAARLAAQQD